MTKYEKACYIIGRLMKIFPTDIAVRRLMPEDVIRKCGGDEKTINFYVLAVRKERNYDV